MPQFATCFLCFIMNGIHTGSNFPFVTAFLPCRLLGVPQNQGQVSCDQQGFFPSAQQLHALETYVESMQWTKWLLGNPFKKLRFRKIINVTKGSKNSICLGPGVSLCVFPSFVILLPPGLCSGSSSLLFSSTASVLLKVSWVFIKLLPK